MTCANPQFEEFGNGVCKTCGRHASVHARTAAFSGDCNWPGEARPRLFPIQQSSPVPWAVAERAYDYYAERYGTSQSLEELASRGGFGLQELACLLERHTPERGHVECIRKNDAVARQLTALVDLNALYKDMIQRAERVFNQMRSDARLLVHHSAWVGYQIAAGQPYNLRPTDAQLASLRDAAARFAEHPDMTPEQNHENWMRYKLANGWRHGPTKDEAAKTHPDLVPFDELPEVEKRKDVMDLEARRLAALL